MKGFHFLSIGFILSALFACHQRQTLFEKIPSSRSAIQFNNEILENDSINPLDVVNIYNGGGMGIGDFNNDGLPDIYFWRKHGLQPVISEQRTFLKFEDVTDQAGVAGLGRWARGISVIDINNDGLMDIYVCNTIYKDPLRRRNILYVNQGIDKNGIPHFKDMAAEYGLDIHVQSTMASFFDYDNDGDLDMYLTVNEAFNGDNPSTFLQRNTRSTAASIGRLYRNDWDSILQHPVFHDVSKEAGTDLNSCYGHAASICGISITTDGKISMFLTIFYPAIFSISTIMTGRLPTG